MEKDNCYICGCGRTERLIDGHHIDCAHGERSDETVPLCRRCHRTYHDLGVEWFDNEFLDRALEVENKRRAIYGIAPMVREDVKRSDYWNKTHGIKEGGTKQSKDDDIVQRFIERQIMPLCGWDWLKQNALESYEGGSVRKGRIASGDMVRIIKAPREAPYLQGLVVKVVDTTPFCVKPPNGFTHLERSAVLKVEDNDGRVN